MGHRIRRSGIAELFGVFELQSKTIKETDMTEMGGYTPQEMIDNLGNLSDDGVRVLHEISGFLEKQGQTLGSIVYFGDPWNILFKSIDEESVRPVAKPD